ncbi:hypothetical protein APF79_00900 [bacterium BRH_c32]|nr:MAG: hypothetical protein APF79_00900 [bacterium BRH_c32]
MKKCFFALILFIFTSNYIIPQADSIKKEEIVQALKDAAYNATEVLLDADGKSRCDYNLIEGKWYFYEPPWHTGQLIYGLVEAYKITKNEYYLEQAKRAGDWWCSLEIKDNPKLNGMLNAIHGDGIENIVFATISDGTNGIFELARVSKDNKYAEVATRAGEWMLNNMYVPEHKIFYDNVDPVTGEVMKQNSPFWKDKKEQTLFDVARPNNEGYLFLDMYKFTSNEKYKKVFIDLCESLVEKQGPEGLWMDFMPNDKSVGSYHPRFNLWYAESLIKGYEFTKDKRYLDAAKKTLEIYAKAQKKDGTIYYVNYIDGRYNENSITGSATAFAGLLWIQLIKYGVGDEFIPNVEQSASWIVKNQFSVNHPDPNLRGAVIDTRTRRKSGKVWLTQRDVGTAFGMRFLADYLNYKYPSNEK